jgi:hypothetical protein
MCEFTIKCGEKFDIYFNNDDEAHHVTVKVHDECEGDNNFPIVEVRKKDGTAGRLALAICEAPGRAGRRARIAPGQRD